MSTPKPTKPPTPQEAAQAALATQGAGGMMDIANQPVQQYGTLYTQSQLGPATTQMNAGLANQAALRSAQAQFDIQSRVDPQAYASRQMRMNAANKRLGELTGQIPQAIQSRAPEAYSVPTVDQLPGLGNLGELSRRIAMNLSTATVDKSGKPQLNWAKGRDIYP